MKKLILFLSILVFCVQSCNKDKMKTVLNPPNPNEEELITTCKLLFSDNNGIQPDVLVQFVDIDGPGGNKPSVFDTIRLAQNTTYTATISLLNESVNPPDDITLEVESEGIDHLFCYDITVGLNLSIVKTDLDSNQLPIGIQSQWTTFGASMGYTTARLKHQPGIKTGDCDLGKRILN